MNIDKAVRRGIEKKDEERQGITAEEIEDYTDERTAYVTKYRKGLEEQVITDALTGLTNRKGLTNELEKALKSLRQPVVGQRAEKRHAKEQPALERFSLLYVDLDNFKILNDARGHSEGDNALKRVAEILKNSARRGAVAARLHGDEFVIFLPRADKGEAERVAERVLASLGSDSDFQKFGISASIGVRHVDTSSLTEQATPETLIKDADLQQTKAKQSGKGKFEIHQGQ